MKKSPSESGRAFLVPLFFGIVRILRGRLRRIRRIQGLLYGLRPTDLFRMLDVIFFTQPQDQPDHRINDRRKNREQNNHGQVSRPKDSKVFHEFPHAGHRHGECVGRPVSERLTVRADGFRCDELRQGNVHRCIIDQLVHLALTALELVP